MAHLTIGELARRAGVRTSAIRYYESIGILPVPPRENGRRRYDARTEVLLRAVAVAKAAGFTLAEIQTLTEGALENRVAPSESWSKMATRKLEELDEVIARAQAMKQILMAGLRCGCLRIEECALVASVGAQE